MSSGVPPAHGALRRDAERNRQRILDAARRLITERGLEVGHNEIAHEAGLGVGTVYRRYPDRQDLLDDVFFDRVHAVASLAERARATDDAWDGLCLYLEGVFEMQSDDRGLREFMGRGGGSDLAARAAAIIQPAVGELVDRAHADGTLRPDVGATDIPLIPLMVGAVMDGAREVDPQLWRRVLALLLDGLSTRPAITPLPGGPPDPVVLADVLGGARTGERHGGER